MNQWLIWWQGAEGPCVRFFDDAKSLLLFAAGWLTHALGANRMTPDNVNERLRGAGRVWQMVECGYG